MVTQKLISFKVSTSHLELFDSISHDLGINRNKFLNHCFRFGLDACILQIEVARRKNLPIRSINFISELV